MQKPTRGPGLPEHPQSYYAEAELFPGSGPAVRAFLHEDYEIGAHRHEFLEVNLVARGVGTHHFQEQVLPTEAGDVYVIPAETVHGYRGQRLDVYHLLLGRRFLEQYGMQLRVLPGFLSLFTVEPYFRLEASFRYGLHLTEAQVAAAAAVLDLIRQEGETPAPGQELALSSLALYLLTQLCRWYSEQHPAVADAASPAPARALQVVYDLVSRRYADPLSLDDLARAANLERTYFCRLFRRATGIPPMEFLAQYRVQVACRLLQQTPDSITAIAGQVGFGDVSHFSRTFSRLVGVPPSRYRS